MSYGCTDIGELLPCLGLPCAVIGRPYKRSDFDALIALTRHNRGSGIRSVELPIMPSFESMTSPWKRSFDAHGKSRFTDCSEHYTRGISKHKA